MENVLNKLNFSRYITSRFTAFGRKKIEMNLKIKKGNNFIGALCIGNGALCISTVINANYDICRTWFFHLHIVHNSLQYFCQIEITNLNDKMLLFTICSQKVLFLAGFCL
jgi:hypothetical protein